MADTTNPAFPPDVAPVWKLARRDTAIVLAALSLWAAADTWFALTESPHASVINVSSAGAYLFSAHTHMYAAAKAGLLAYTRSLAAELAPRKIRVNAIAPGTIDTDMVRNNPPAVQETMAKASLLGRAAAPDEVAGLALYLASDASSFVTGTTVNVDGGLVPR